MILNEAVKNRRSHYDITDSSPISNERIEEILRENMTFVPSAFHSQTSRVVLLFGERHKKLWSIVRETLQAMIPPEQFSSTDQKLSSFAAGHGTILFFEEMDTVAQLQQSFPLYADNFPVWSNQSSGMLQFAVWTALSAEGLGASLQHYNPLIDARTAQEFGAPASWKLIAQMPFGAPKGQSQPQTYKPTEERLMVQGGEV